MKEAKKITSYINIKLNKSSTLYHGIQVFINMKQYKAEPNNAFKLRFDKSYAIYHDMRSQTGGAISMVLGFTH